MNKIIAIPFLAAAIFYGGCGLVSVMGTPTAHEIKIPAEYDLSKHKGSKILVLVNQSLLVKSQVNIRYYLTEAVNKLLASKTKIPDANFISYDKLAKYRSSKINFEQLSPEEIGKGLGANLVLTIDIYSFELEQIEDTDYYKGSVNGKAALIDVVRDTKLWPESEDARTIKVGFDTGERDQQKTVERLIADCAHCTTRYLYNCPKDEFKIFDERTDSAWQDWEMKK